MEVGSPGFSYQIACLLQDISIKVSEYNCSFLFKYLILPAIICLMAGACVL